jgi:predicted DNA-binding antitoxin AbrB/MazE fold protein
MTAVQAVYEHGVLRPLQPVDLQEGQHVTISVKTRGLTREQAEAELAAWHRVYEGLSGEDIAEIERIALDRSNFMRPPREDADDDV